MRISDWSSDVCSSDLIEYDRKLNSRNGVAPGEMHLDSIAESRGFDGWEIKIRDIADLQQFAPVHGRDRLTDRRRSEAATLGRASCRERVGQSGWLSVGAVALKKKRTKKKSDKT